MDRSLDGRPAIILAALLSLFGCCSMVMASDSAWFSGGGFDGYGTIRSAVVPDFPQVNNAEGATNVTFTHACLNGMLLTTGGAPAQVYVFWGVTDGGTNRDTWANNHNFGDPIELTPLTHEIAVESGTVYYYRFHATNTLGEIGWSTVSSVFQTPAPPVVTTGGAGVGITTAVLSGHLTAGIEAVVTIYWGENSNDWTHVIDLGTRPVAGTLAAPNPFLASISGLLPATDYAYRIYASNDFGTAWSDLIRFSTYPTSFATTPDSAWFSGGGFDGYETIRSAGVPDYPQVNNAEGATNVTFTHACLNGVLLTAGGAPAQVYVFWGVTDGGTNRDTWANNHNFGDPIELTPLTHEIAVESGTVYYYRFHATNTLGGIGWSAVSSVFQTPAPPAVTTGMGVGVGITNAFLYGHLTAGIEAVVTIYWGENSNDWTHAIDLGTRTVEGTLAAPNPFSTLVSGLLPATDYAYRIYASNDFGTAWSDLIWFSTSPASFVTTPDSAWFSGGGFDGYDHIIADDGTLPGIQSGSVISFK